MNNKLRVAIVVSHPIQHFCPQYVSFAENRGIEFKVFFASMLGYKKYLDPNFKKEISWSNLNLDKFQHEFLNGEKVIQADKNIDAPSLNNALNVFSPGLVITYGYFQRLQRRAHKWARKNNVPLAYISDSELRKKRNRLKELLKFPFLYRYFSSIHFFLSVGDANETFYRRFGVKSRKMVRMHFPIDIKCYQIAYANRSQLESQIREQYNIPGKETVLSVVGKLVPWKNQGHLIDALVELEKKNIAVHLFIIGSGEMMEPLKKKATLLKRCKVYFTGFIPVDELPAYYAATDIYVHPAYIEPHSIAVSEAVYMGCPVILSDTCGSYGPGDDVQPGKNGYVYEFGNISQLTEKIMWLIENIEDRKMKGAYSHEIATKFQENAHYLIINKLAYLLTGKMPAPGLSTGP